MLGDHLFNTNFFLNLNLFKHKIKESTTFQDKNSNFILFYFGFTY